MQIPDVSRHTQRAVAPTDNLKPRDCVVIIQGVWVSSHSSS